jgi:hypothetical protein
MSIFFTGDSSILGNIPQQPSRADQLMEEARRRLREKYQYEDATRERLGNAGAAARMKMREQEEQGVRSYAPANPEAANVELTKRMLVPNLPMPSATPTPTELRQRPTGGVIASYGPNERVVTSRYGTGSAIVGGTGKPATFDGKSKASFFGQAAARQGEDNKYARAEKTGKVDELGNPKFTSKAIPKGLDAGTERVFEAIKKGRPMPTRQADEYDARKAAEARWKERLAS